MCKQEHFLRRKYPPSYYPPYPKILVEKGKADVNVQRKFDGLTALAMAVRNGHGKLARMLVVDGHADANTAAQVQRLQAAPGYRLHPLQ